MIELKRRSVIVGAALLTLANKVHAQEEEVGAPDPNWTSVWHENESVDQYFFGEAGPPADAATGPGDPTSDDVLTAFKIVYSTPNPATPYEIAQYFTTLPQVGSEGVSFRQEWPNRANPLIVAFFGMTQTRPSGDVTPWCAAFVNFCLAAAGRTPTMSAASASFRGEEPFPSVQDPRIGDLVVFRDTSDNDHGHVGFYAGRPSGGASGVLVLGGNQGDGIKVSRYPTSNLAFHSFHRVP